MSSSDGGVLAEGETSTSETSGDSTSPPCDLGLFERLLLTHPVWFLPGIQRAGAVHLLQGKEEGVSFVGFAKGEKWGLRNCDNMYVFDILCFVKRAGL